jgi:hypothetical protein
MQPIIYDLRGGSVGIDDGFDWSVVYQDSVCTIRIDDYLVHSMIYHYAVRTIGIDDDRLSKEATAEKDENGDEEDSFHRLLYFKN